MMFFRVDGNEEIATGHVMRCLSIADALKELGEDSTFILADDRPSDLIKGRGFDVHVLDSVWSDMETELTALKAYLERQNAGVLLIDSYFVTKHYLEELRKAVKVAYIDDMRAFVYPVDLIISYGYLSEQFPYEKDYETYGTGFLQGSSYAPLRNEFRDVSYVVNEDVTDVLITTGGTDNFNVAGKLLERVAANDSYSDIHFHVVVGKFNCNKDMLAGLEKENGSITLYENISNMSELMQQCDIAVTASGSTTYELCAVGIPSICFSIAENQQEGAKAWERNGIMFYAGDMQVDETGCIEGVLSCLERYRSSFELRVEKSRRMRQLVDGKGALRIAEALLKKGRKKEIGLLREQFNHSKR